MIDNEGSAPDSIDVLERALLAENLGGSRGPSADLYGLRRHSVEVIQEERALRPSAQTPPPSPAPTQAPSSVRQLKRLVEAAVLQKKVALSCGVVSSVL